MEKIAHLSTIQRVKRAWTALVIGALLVPAGLGSTPAAAVGSTPGPIPQVTLSERGASSVTMAWSAPWTDGGSPITDYGIEVRPEGGAWERIDDGVSTATTSVVPGLLPDVDYNVRVFAINDNGRGPATVYGAMSTLLSSNDERCGALPGKTLDCFTVTKAPASVTYYDYPSVDSASRHVATDIIDIEGQCYLSRTQGVLCSSVWQNRYGELGQGLTGGPLTRFRVPIPTDSSIVSISSDSMRNCALDSARRLWCWGFSKNASGQNQNLLDPTVVKTGVIQYEGSCARLWDDTVECLNADYKWTSIPGMTPLRKIASNYGHSWSSCGITAERKTLCFNTVEKTWSERTEWEGAVELFRGEVGASCALIENGQVKCYAVPNYHGELGDGNRDFGGFATVRMPEPAIAIATNKRIPANGNVASTCAVGVSSTVYCWGEFVANRAVGQIVSSVPLELTGGGAATVRTFSRPSSVPDLAQAARAASSVTVAWNPASSPDISVSGYVVRWRLDGASTWTTEATGLTRSWTSPTLEPRSTLQVQVAAVNAAGQGPWSNTLVATTTEPPGRPLNVHEVSHTANSVTVGWDRSSDEDEPVTGYRVERSYDGVNWTAETVGRDTIRATMINLISRSAIQVRIKATNAAGESAFSDPIVVTTSGTGAQTLTVRDSFGTAVTGGRVTWVTPSGSFQSAVDYGLTSSGTVSFPIAPAGIVNLTLSGVTLPGGSTASLQTTAIFGQGRNPVVDLPAEPSRSQHVVRVTLPNGMPVMGATVSASSLDGIATVDATTFTTPTVVTSGVTNEFGEVYLVGYSNDSTTLAIEFNDGVLIQRLNGFLGRTDAEFQFEEMPWVDPQIDTTTANVGALVSIPVVAAAPNSTVSVKAPVGAAQTCAGRVLSARTDSAGRVTLKACASATGKFTVVSAGAVSTGAVTVFARGTRSLAVRDTKAVSRSHATASVSWVAPVFTGGNPITNYTVKLTSPAGAVLTKNVTTTTASFTGLAGAKTYTVTVIPNTRLGAGAAVVTKVPVS